MASSVVHTEEELLSAIDDTGAEPPGARDSWLEADTQLAVAMMRCSLGFQGLRGDEYGAFSADRAWDDEGELVLEFEIESPGFGTAIPTIQYAAVCSPIYSNVRARLTTTEVEPR